MPTGTLEVIGNLSVDQFWPEGSSDADTVNIIVDVTDDSFRFQPHDDAPLRPTRFYRGATVVGRQRKAPVNASNKMTIRLQGLDAPELHYRPSPLSRSEKQSASSAQLQSFKNANHSYRQFLGATAAKALHDFVRRAGADTIACRVVTHVDKPNEVFDTYARFVGDIEITIAGAGVNVNRWLVENGWAFPGFYVSMNDDEITGLIDLAAAARRARKGIWRHYSRTIHPFDFTLLQPKKGQIEVLDNDKGPVLFPKLFRRQTSWAVRKKAKIFSGTLQRFLEGQSDPCFETSDFLENGLTSATPHNFVDFVGRDRTTFDPADLVFSEAKSQIIDASGQPITDF